MNLKLRWLFLWYIRFFAKIAVSLGHPVIIGITGSVGKSSTRNALSTVLVHYKKTKTIFEGNSETGIPLGILGLSPNMYSIFDWITIVIKAPWKITGLIGIDYLIVEMGIDEPDKPKNMEYLLTIVQPEISIFLNVYAVHTEQFGKKLSTNASQEDIITSITQEKGKIITHNAKCKIAIYNSQNEYISEALKVNRRKSIAYYSFGDSENDAMKLAAYSITLDGTQFKIKSNDGKTVAITFKNQILPQSYWEVFAATLLTSSALSIPIEDAVKHISENFELPKSRGSVFKGIYNSTIIDSSYNCSRRAVVGYLELLAELKKTYHRPVIFLFGDMRELGELAKEEHEAAAKQIVKAVDYLYCVGPLTKKYVVHDLELIIKNEELRMREVKWFKNSIEAGTYLRTHLPENALILVKGSQNGIYLEEAIKELLEDDRDIKKLCRQNEFWLKKKSTFFNTKTV